MSTCVCWDVEAQHVTDYDDGCADALHCGLGFNLHDLTTAYYGWVKQQLHKCKIEKYMFTANRKYACKKISV